MKAKDKRTPVEEIKNLLMRQNGVLLTSDLARLGIPRTYLSLLIKKGEVERIARGVYASPTGIVDEMSALQARYKNAVFSHETALFLWDLSDRTPLFHSVTVPAGYNATLIKANGAKVFYAKKSLFPLGLTIIRSPHGNDIKTYNLERTICDVVRNRNQLDPQYLTEAVKRYMGKKEKNLSLLYHYAEQFRIQRIIRPYIEVLL